MLFFAVINKLLWQVHLVYRIKFFIHRVLETITLPPIILKDYNYAKTRSFIYKNGTRILLWHIEILVQKYKWNRTSPNLFPENVGKSPNLFPENVGKSPNLCCKTLMKYIIYRNVLLRYWTSISDNLSARYRGRFRRSSSWRMFLVEKRKDNEGE